MAAVTPKPALGGVKAPVLPLLWLDVDEGEERSAAEANVVIEKGVEGGNDNKSRRQSRARITENMAAARRAHSTWLLGSLR